MAIRILTMSHGCYSYFKARSLMVQQCLIRARASSGLRSVPRQRDRPLLRLSWLRKVRSELSLARERAAARKYNRASGCKTLENANRRLRRLCSFLDSCISCPWWLRSPSESYEAQTLLVACTAHESEPRASSPTRRFGASRGTVHHYFTA